MTSQDSAEVEVNKQVAALISQIESIKSDESRYQKLHYELS